jgi:hypothetical protein
MEEACKSKITADDEEFLRNFEDCSLSGKCWTHAAHIRMAWLQLERSSSFEEALEKIRAGIKKFNSSQNSIGYHETITVAFAHLINHRRQTNSARLTCQQFMELNADLLSKEQPALHYFYSPSLLASAEAKAKFIAPDLQELPALK